MARLLYLEAQGRRPQVKGMEESRILIPGRNCWRIGRSPRAAFLVDAEAYYAAFAAAVGRARQSVLILGWDIDSRIRLHRSGRQRTPPALGKFLDALVSRRRGLHIHVLDWDFAMIYAFEREALPLFKLGLTTHRRLHFRLDDRHPVGASHHQKVVVVDDRVAFVGGLDLASCRWDTPAHLADDPRRTDNGTIYSPFHDVQMMVDGEVAAALGELARERWRRAIGERLRPPRPQPQDPWPPGISADATDVQVGVARTHPLYNGDPEVREVEALYLDGIAAARRTLYLENQYFTSAAVGEALAARLREPQGPEVVLVLPRECSGWLEETTMGVLRGRLLRRLREADRHDRLRIYYPDVAGLGERFLNVHSKVMIVDDRLLRIGSSNLSNRSMGFDTECDLALEADRPEAREAVVRFRGRLLGEHLGVEPGEVHRAEAERGSLIQAIEALRGAPRTLVPLEAKVEPWLDQLVPEWEIVDPERPISMERFVEEIVPKDPVRGGKLRWLKPAGILFALLALAGVWRYTPLREWVSLDVLEAWGLALRGSPWAPLVVVAVYVTGGLVLAPVTVLILATALAFSPLAGFVYALAGVLASAAMTYAIGQALGRDTVRRLAGSGLNRLSRQLARRGLIAVVVVRFLPIAPFSVVNLVAGASHIRFRDFFLGTALGMGPGILGITVFGQSLERAVRTPGPMSFLALAAVLAGVGGIAWLLRRWLKTKVAGEPGHE